MTASSRGQTRRAVATGRGELAGGEFGRARRGEAMALQRVEGGGGGDEGEVALVAAAVDEPGLGLADFDDISLLTGAVTGPAGSGLAGSGT